jgi:uncharacterized membrane protein YgcG
MEVIAPVACHACADKIATEEIAYHPALWENAVEKLIDDVWAVLVQCRTGFETTCKDKRAEKFGFLCPALPWYIKPPPSYDDAVNDLPPEYPALPPLAERKTALSSVAPPAPVTKSRSQSHSLYKDTSLDVYIEFESTAGVREHKKKKGGGGGAAKKPAAPPPPADTGGSSNGAGDDQANGDGNSGGDTGGGDGGGDDSGGGGGGGDGGGDDWNAWGTVGSTKKKTKKQEEEEEEERKAAETAATAKNNLSWADDAEDGGGDDWDGFNTAGKKKKAKVSKYTSRNPTKSLILILPRRMRHLQERFRILAWTAELPN